MFKLHARRKFAGLVMTLVLAAELLPNCVPQARGDTFRAMSSDSADHSCQVILRTAALVLNPETGLPETETDRTGRTWYSFEAFVDSAAAPLKTGASVQLLYRGHRDSNWHTAPGVVTTGAANTLQRHQFRISKDTLSPRNSDLTAMPPHSDTLYLIPFLQSTDGRRIFDHNSETDLSQTYVLNSANNWRVATNPKTCERAGRGSATLRFLGNWSLEPRGDIHPGQSLLIEYDLSRLPQCQASSYNGLPAWQTEAFIRFFPNGEEYSAALNSFQGGSMLPVPAHFEIPNEATRAQVWFRTRGRGCEGGWDSNFGKNYEFEIRSGVLSSPSWAGEWRLLNSGSTCSEASNSTPLSDVTSISDQDLHSPCLAVEAEVLVPGLTTAIEANPKSIQAQVNWKTDTGQPATQWLTYVGRNGQNYRYRWEIPAGPLKLRPWKNLDFSFQFSTDGLFWLRAGRATGTSIGIVAPRRFELIP